MLNDIDKKILKEFRSLPYDFWDFSKSDTSELVHGLHSYPAVMIYPISRNILNIVMKFKKIDCLMDPFVGSGTVVVEGEIARISKIIGNDLNPLATLITKAKTAKLNENDYNQIEEILNNISNDYISKEEYINEFCNFIRETYDISSKDGWGNQAFDLIKNNLQFDAYSNIPTAKNLGYWFVPEAVIALSIIKSHLPSDSKISPFMMTSFSEFVRYISNTRNSEFKLYRMESKKIYNNVFNYVSEFKRIVDKNIIKMKSYIDSKLELNSNIIILEENSMSLPDYLNDTVDIVITSPPYGDSHTTVAYGQFSSLSLKWLDMEEKNVDSLLLGGKIKKVEINQLDSKTLDLIYLGISSIDKKRANEVLSFYHDVDKTLESISRVTKNGGYQFWVVGNRNVKGYTVPTDVIIEELAKKHDLVLLDKFYRRISNKVMPSKNSPTNISGLTVNTMNKEIIMMLKKELN